MLGNWWYTRFSCPVEREFSFFWNVIDHGEKFSNVVGRCTVCSIFSVVFHTRGGECNVIARDEKVVKKFLGMWKRTLSWANNEPCNISHSPQLRLSYIPTKHPLEATVPAKCANELCNRVSVCIWWSAKKYWQAKPKSHTLLGAIRWCHIYWLKIYALPHVRLWVLSLCMQWVLGKEAQKLSGV